MNNNSKVKVSDLNALEYLSLIQDTTPISCLRGADISSLTKAVVFDTLVGPRAIICFLDYMDEMTYMMGVPETMEMTGFVRVKSTLSEEDLEKDPDFSKGHLPRGVTWTAVFNVAQIALKQTSLAATSKVVDLPAI